MLALNRKRLGKTAHHINYVQADLFNWKPDAQYAVVFFSFWLSHVPPEKFAGFWETVSAALAPGGRVFFIDSRPAPNSTAADQRIAAADITSLRRLNDGREFTIYKLFYKLGDLKEQLAHFGWQIEVNQTPQYFLYGKGGKR